MISNKVYCFKYILEDNVRKNIYEQLVKIHKNFNYEYGEHNIPFSGPFADDLFEVFKQKCSEIYGPFTIIDTDKKETAWCYLNNKDCYKGENKHTHIKSATYVGVYYLNVPKPKDKFDGCLKFFNLNLEVVDYFFPQTSDFLIFEADMIHSITKSNLKEYRISIALEILVTKQIEFLWI